MLRGFCNRPCLRNLIHTGNLLSESGDVIAQNEFLPLLKAICKLLLCRIPLEESCILTTCPVWILFDGIDALTLQILDGRQHMVLFQRIDPLETLCNLLNRIVALIIDRPWLLILGLQIVYHQQVALILEQCERIVVVAQLLLKGLSCSRKLIEGRRNRDTGLIKGRLVPVENLTCSRDRNRLLLSGDNAGIKRRLIIICKIIKDIGVII